MKMSKADALETYSYYAKELKSRFPDLAYLHAIEGRDGITATEPEDHETLDFLVSRFDPAISRASADSSFCL